jgi:hypothetical protein
MKKLLDSEESTSTPVQSRKTVVAENASPEKLQLQVQSDLLDESLTKVRVQRTRSDGSVVVTEDLLHSFDSVIL